jgi:hypothetical protein
MRVTQNQLTISQDLPLNSDVETYGNPISNSTSLPSYEIPSTTQPMLITPVIEPSDIPPKGSGASVVSEPELVTPIIKNEKPIKLDYANIPSIGGDSVSGSDSGQVASPKIKKPNYILYGGILLAVIIAYKLLSSNKNN